MTEILNLCDSCNVVEGGLAPSASLPPPLRASHLFGLEDKIIDCARSWLGTPFRHQGRKKGVGVDCLGLLIGVAAELNLPLTAFDEPGYGHYPNEAHLQKRLAEALQSVETPKPGCIGLFAVDGRAQHLAIFGNLESGIEDLEQNNKNSRFPILDSRFLTLIHAYAPARKVVEHGFTAEWRGRLVACYVVNGPFYD